MIWRLAVPLRVCIVDNINNNEMSMASSVLSVISFFVCMDDEKNVIEKTYPFHCCYHVEYDNYYLYLPY